MARSLLTCQRKGCGGPRQVALLIEWESMRSGKGPMRAMTGLEVCRPCAWKIKEPTSIMSQENVDKIRETIAKSGIGMPKAEAKVRYCDLTHPEYVKFKRMMTRH